MAYAYRGKPHEDEWENTNYCDDHVCRTVIIDSDGREETAIGCSPYQDSVDNYVVQSEKTEHVYSPHLTEFGHSSPKKKVEYEPKWRRPSSPDHTPEIDDFLNRIQIDASRPHNYSSNPSGGSTIWRPNPKPKPKPNPNPNPKPHKNGYDGYNNKRSTGNYPIRNDKYDEYYRKDSPTREWDRPVNHATTATRPAKISSTGRDTKLGLPTNSIEEAIDYLKGANAKISPAAANGINGSYQTQSGRPYVPPRIYEVEEGPPRRYEQNRPQYQASSPRIYEVEEGPPRRYEQNRPQYQASSPWPHTASPPTHGYGYGHGPGAVIDSDEAAKRYGGKIVRI